MTGWSLAYFLVFHSVAYAIWHGLGVNVSWPNVVMMQILIFALFSVVPTPGGSGALELGALTFLAIMAPPQTAGLFVILWRFFSFYLNLGVGWIALTGIASGNLKVSSEPLVPRTTERPGANRVAEHSPPLDADFGC